MPGHDYGLADQLGRCATCGRCRPSDIYDHLWQCDQFLVESCTQESMFPERNVMILASDTEGVFPLHIRNPQAFGCLEWEAKP